MRCIVVGREDDRISLPAVPKRGPSKPSLVRSRLESGRRAASHEGDVRRGADQDHRSAEAENRDEEYRRRLSHHPPEPGDPVRTASPLPRNARQQRTAEGNQYDDTVREPVQQVVPPGGVGDGRERAEDPQ